MSQVRLSASTRRPSSTLPDMTEEKKSSVLYLSKSSIASVHAALAHTANKQGEPIPPFKLAKDEELDALVTAPQQSFYGQEAYPSLEEKAAIIFYTINKRQIFLNGNKRMSTLCLLVFLGINEKWLDVSPDALTEKALWLANTSSLEFPNIKQDLVAWVREHMIDMPLEN